MTILGIGLFIHWLIPAITVAAGFALAAILSPTDPVAVSAMTASSPLPSRMAHILEGESFHHRVSRGEAAGQHRGDGEIKGDEP